jgi:hypothetical protein
MAIRHAVAALVGLAAAAVAAPLRAEPSVSILPLAFPVSTFRGPSSRVAELVGTTDALRGTKSLRDQPRVVVWGVSGGAVLTLRDKAVEIVPLTGGSGDLVALEQGRKAIPASRLSAAGPLTVTLTDESHNYEHAALGSAVHASVVTVMERQPVEPGAGPKPVPIVATRILAGQDAVFEDREARIADLDGDGTPEIVVIKSYRDRGAALAVIARKEGAWSVVAETPPAGAPQAWLNPAVIADFRGTGRLQIALVRQPHAHAILELWSYEGGALVKRAEKAGFSNHAFGETAQGLAAAIERTKGVVELAIPTADRRAIVFVSLKDGIVENGRIALPAPAKTGVAVLGSGADAHILVGLEDGRIADLRP